MKWKVKINRNYRRGVARNYSLKRLSEWELFSLDISRQVTKYKRKSRAGAGVKWCPGGGFCARNDISLYLPRVAKTVTARFKPNRLEIP